MLLVLSGAALWHATEAHEDKNHSGSDDGKYRQWKCVCNPNMTNATNSSFWKDHEHWGNATNRTVGEDEDGHHGDLEDWDEEGHHGDHEKGCMCGSTPGQWEFIGRHGKDSDRWSEDDKKEHKGSHHENNDSKQWDKDDKRKHKGSHHENKDVDIDLVIMLVAGGTIAGGLMVAVICCVCQRKRVWVTAPPAVGTCVLGRPTTDDVKQTHVVVGGSVENGAGSSSPRDVQC